MTSLSPASFRRLAVSSRFSPVALAALLGLALPLSAGANGGGLPSAYSLSEDGWMPTVKDQGGLASCWSFATTSTYESSLLRQGIVSGLNDPNVMVSVWHLATANGNETVLKPVQNPKTGEWDYPGWTGLNEFAIGYWTRGIGSWELKPEVSTLRAGGGPVLIADHPNNLYPLEASDQNKDLTPYVPPEAQPLAPHGLRQSITYQWDFDPGSLGDFQESLKDGILKYGAMSAMVRIDKGFTSISPTNEAFLSTDIEAGSNHVVDLVGWDDDRVFTINGVDYTGGWLLQNSWGADWGTSDPVSQQKGFLWLPYADISHANVKRALAVVTRSNRYADNVHVYSPMVMQNQYFAPYYRDDFVFVSGFEAGTPTYAIQKLVAPRGPSKTTLGSLALWAPHPGLSVDIAIYDQWNPADGFHGQLLAQFDWTFSSDGSGGYQEIDLAAPLEFNMGESFFVFLDFGDGYDYPLAVDVRTAEQLGGNPDFSGLSWMSNNLLDWYDLGIHLEVPGVFFLKGLSIFIELPADGHVSGLMQTYSFANVPELIFDDGSELYLNAPITIEGGLLVAAGNSELRGNFISHAHFEDHLLFTGGGELSISAPVTVHGGTHIIDGRLNVGNSFVSEGDIRVIGDFFVMGPRENWDTVGAVTAPSVTVESHGIVLVEKGASLTLNGQTDEADDFLGGNFFNRGLVRGSGVINAYFYNLGTLSPGFSPGTIVVTGDYTQEPDGLYIVEVAGENHHDRLIIGGTAYLNGTLFVGGIDGYALQLGDKYRGILEADRIEGEFSEVILPDGLRSRLLEDDGSLDLLIAPVSYTQLAVTPNEKQVARALDEFIPATSGDRFTVSLALDELRADEYGKAFQAIMPSFYQGVAGMGVDLAIGQTQHLSQRLDALRFGAPTGYTTQGIAPVLANDGKQSVTAGKSIAAAAKETVLLPSPDNAWGVWTQATGIFGKNYSITDVPNYSYDSGGFLVGADYRWNRAFSTGLFAGYQGAESRYPDAGKAQSDSVNFGLYAAYGKETGFHASGIVMGGQSRFDVSRRIEFGTIDRTANSNFDAWTGTALLETGYAFQLGAFRIGPVVSAQYTKLDADDFTEKNAKSLNLKVSDFDNESFQTNVGARIAAPVVVSPEVTLVPELRVLWNHEFMQDNASYLARLDGGKGRSFRYDQTSPSRDSVTVGTGFAAHLGANWNATAFYNVNCGSSQSVTHSVSASVGFSF